MRKVKPQFTEENESQFTEKEFQSAKKGSQSVEKGSQSAEKGSQSAEESQSNKEIESQSTEENVLLEYQLYSDIVYNPPNRCNIVMT